MLGSPTIVRPELDEFPIERVELPAPLIDLANLGFSLYEGRALNTVPLAEVRVEHAFDLATLTLDATSLLLTAGNMALGFTGVGSSVTTPLSIIQTLAFSPATYGAPILKGVMQSMCAV
ncbi:hypothetical protein ACFYT3_27575 [Nocardia amikacinitolerans]|uniref:hypothetical protein n=1 Tax=Nocardia amikacinitolerans TaxID=756689 RepID=UPI0020A354FB|nr:hypothetical protein [Nocardia amikacinitolerans]MCP2291230.1 hypothetical protein [Nocardia amikacinitolerans]